MGLEGFQVSAREMETNEALALRSSTRGRVLILPIGKHVYAELQGFDKATSRRWRWVLSSGFASKKERSKDKGREEKPCGNECKCTARLGALNPKGTQARTTAARKSHAVMNACARRGWTPRNPRGDPGEDNGSEEKRTAMSASARRGWTPKSKVNPGEESGSEENPCGNESMCEARLDSPKSKGEPRRGQRQRRKAHGNECKCVAKLGS